jgi:hypothetical protein
MFDVKNMLARAASLLQAPVVRLLFVYPWSGKVSILRLEEACRKPGSRPGIVFAIFLAVCLSLLGGLLASFSAPFYFSLVSQIYHRDGLAYLWQPLAVLALVTVSIFGMAFLTADWLERWHDYASAKWAWFSFVVTAGVLTAAMHLALYVCARLPGYLLPDVLYSGTAFSLIVGICAFAIIAGSLAVFLSLVLGKVKQVVQPYFYEQHRLAIGLTLGVIWTCFLLVPSAFLQSLHAVRGDPAKLAPVWKLPTAGMTMIGCDAVDKSIVCAFTIASHNLPDLVVAGRWRSVNAGDNTAAWVGWDAIPAPGASAATVPILPGKVLDLTLRAGRDDVCRQAAQGKARLQFQARARGTTPPFNERQRLSLAVVNGETFTQELLEACG